MAVQVLSDLHLETPKGYDLYEIVPRAPYLALLGDIGNVVSHKDELLAFLTVQLQQFKVIFFVPGNHEAYHSNWAKTLNVLETFEEDVRSDNALGDFVLLNRRAFRLLGTNTVILGCSLFSHVPPKHQMAVEMGLNDFYQIENWTVAAHNQAHQGDLGWLNTQVAELEREEGISIMIFTHWSPSQDARVNDPRHAGSAISTAFASDLSKEVCFRSGCVRIWAFGHTHYNCDVEVMREDNAGPLKLLANQRGYYFAQAPGFDQGKVVQL